MKNLLKKLRQRATLWVFNYFFGNLVYSFETANEKFAKLTETQKTYYYESVSDWLVSIGHEIESTGLMEQLYKELATKSKNEDEMMAYRLVMLLVKNQEIRLQGKVIEYQAINAQRKSFNNLNV